MNNKSVKSEKKICMQSCSSIDTQHHSAT